MEFKVKFRTNETGLKRLAKIDDMASVLFLFEQFLVKVSKNCDEDNKEVELIKQMFYDLLNERNINIEDLNT